MTTASPLLSSQVQFRETEPQQVTIPSAATASLGMVGICERGPVATEVLCQSFDLWQRKFGGYTLNNQDTILAVKGFFDEGGTELHFVRTVHFTSDTDPTTKTSASGSTMLDTTAEAASAGSVTSSNTGPFLLAPGQTLALKVDGGGTLTTTFTATAGFATSGAAPFALSNGENLTGTVDGAHAWNVPFTTGEFGTIGAALASEVVAVLNAYFAANAIPALASVSGSDVVITSNSKGSASAVTITGGTASGTLGFTSTAGTGNVPNIAAVTTTQALALILATGATLANASGAVKITSNTTGGSSSVQVLSSSTAGAELGFDNAIHAGNSGAAVPTLDVVASGDGSFSSQITGLISTATNGLSDHFNLTVYRSGLQVEIWPNISLNEGAADYGPTVVNDQNTGSQYVTLVDQFAAVASPGNLPTAGSFGPLAGGSDGLAGLVDADYVGGTGVNGDVGLRALDGVDDLSLLAVPGRATPTVQLAMITYCEITRYGLVFAIMDPPKNQSAAEIVNYVQNTAALSEVSERAAIYWPNLLVANPSPTVYGAAVTLVAPPSGAIAGLMARVDASTDAGPFVHPAGLENGQLFSALGLEMPEVKKKAARDLVFPALINPITTGKNQPIFVDGARCLKDDGNWPTVGERRGIIYVEASGIIGLQPIRQKNINDRLFNEAQLASYNFLEGLCKAGAFPSTDPTQAFSVDFGAGLNTAATMKARQVLGKWTICTSPPAEYVVVNVSPDTRALDAQLAALQQQSQS